MNTDLIRSFNPTTDTTDTFPGQSSPFSTGLSKLLGGQPLNHREFTALLDSNSESLRAKLADEADKIRRK